MAEDRAIFWNALHERWRAEDPKQEVAAVVSVLWHLANRLPAPEARRVEDQLPGELRELWPAPERRPEHVHDERRVQKLDRTEFLMRVGEEAELPGGTTTAAVGAVFHALGRCLDEQERARISAQLPPDIRALWHEEAL